ncbi:MAG: hypothetical protein HDR53_07870 [Treponema sp.]|nr:hypothetical protein [Treponema sp.]
MTYKILKGEELGFEYLQKIMDIDEEVYSDLGMEGALGQMEKRYRKNKETFVVLENAESGEVVGYINFFPVNEETFQDILCGSEQIRDDDIEPEEMADYAPGCHIYIISVAIREKYRGKESGASKALSDAWIAYLNELADKYGLVEREKRKDGTLGKVRNTRMDISGTTVSEGGQRFLRNHFFVQRRTIENNEKVCICEGKRLKKLLNNELNFKTFRDDIYLFLPFSVEGENTVVNTLFDSKEKCIPEKRHESDIPYFLMEKLKECIDYECENFVAEELETIYLGNFSFLHTDDLYEGDVVGEEEIHCLLTAHRKTHLYVLTMIFTDSKFYTSQIEDQFSYNYLKIKDPNNGDEYVDVEDYFEKKYGLVSCGKGKILICMSSKPEKPEEFRHIMAAEVYNGLEQDYTLCCDGEIAKKWCETDCTHYNSYSIFLSNSVIAFIPDEFNSDVEERIGQMATYAFIALLTMFQNTAIARINKKIANALSYEGKISNEKVLELYKEFGKTAHFWEIHNYRYIGAQLEAESIMKAFGNVELMAECKRQQEFLEKIVNLQASENARQSGFLLNIMAVVIAADQLRNFVEEVITNFYYWINEGKGFPKLKQTNPCHAYHLIIVGGFILFLVIRKILKSKSNRIEKKILMHKKKCNDNR